MSAHGAPTCPKCSRPVLWANTTNGARLSLDATPTYDTSGSYTVDFDAVPLPEAEYIGPYRAAAVRPATPRYTRHLDTCPGMPRPAADVQE